MIVGTEMKDEIYFAGFQIKLLNAVEVQSHCSKCSRQTGGHAYIIRAPAIVDVYLTLSILHFLSEMSPLGGRRDERSTASRR